MKKSELRQLIREVLQEQNVTNAGGASFKPGQGEQYASAKAFGGAKRAKKTLQNFGFKETSIPKKEYHTKMFDYKRFSR